MNLAKKILKISKEDDVEVRYSHILRILCDWINCWILVVIGGRGLAKSTEIQAERTLAAIYDMPGSPMAIIADTYVNLSSKIMLAIKIGWKRKGYHEGIHYVCNQRPPEEWLKRCSITGIENFKNTVFWHNGTVIFGGSLDRPSLLAGLSVVHIFSDESKYQADTKINNTLPILRGDAIRYGHSVFFLGMTITCDMPDVNNAEYDWFLKYVKDMDPERIVRILQIYNELNKVRIKILKESQKSAPNSKKLDKLYKEEEYWLNGWIKARQEQTFFINASSLVNIEILTLKYLKQLYKPEDVESFKKSVLGMRPTLNKQERFYPLMSEGHFYYDGFDYGYYDKFAYGELTENSKGLKYLNHNQPLDIGMDFGNMISMLVGQESNGTNGVYRIHKEFYEIPPNWIRDIADQFLEYFSGHDNKEINLYYDRAANNYRKQGKDLASEIKDALEKNASGDRTGWVVNLKSRRQGTIYQGTEYFFAMELMKGENKELPRLLIDAHNCKCLKSSMEKAPREVKLRQDGTKVIVKVKKSEKLAIRLLPMYSTNFSDAFKYLICRSDWLKISRNLRRLKSDDIIIP